MIPLSILELARINDNTNAKIALDNAQDLAKHAERLGYTRFWLAEHHNFAGIASAATAIAISHVAQGTKTIRVGAGGIMLPNHSPMVIAEQFGTLAHLYPNRIDLGLGRAPGTDQLTVRALRRSAQAADHFPQDVQELQRYFSAQAHELKIRAVPACGTQVPLWILGSSTFGAMLAAELGLPYSFASHFAPQQLDAALSIYRQRFKPSAECAAPYAMVGVNVICAETDEQARHLFTTQQMGFADLVSGKTRLGRAPIADIDSYWSPNVQYHAMQMLSCSVIGSEQTVKAGLEALQARTHADELIIVCDIYQHSERLASIERIAKLWGL